MAKVRVNMGLDVVRRESADFGRVGTWSIGKHKIIAVKPYHAQENTSCDVKKGLDIFMFVSWCIMSWYHISAKTYLRPCDWLLN
jgi:hypothetical protein